MTDTSQNDPKIGRAAAVTAAHQGGEAQRAGKTIADCPYSPTGPLGIRFRAHFWRKGYALAQSAQS